MPETAAILRAFEPCPDSDVHNEAAAMAHRPQLDVTKLHREVTERAWALFREKEGLGPRHFRYAETVVRLITTETGNVLTKPETFQEFRAAVDANIACYRVSKGDTLTLVYAPHDLCTMMLNDVEAPLPLLRGIRRAPAFGADGQLRIMEGYNPADRFYLSLDFIPLPVPAAPTSADLAESRHLIETELLGDFPFQDDSDRAAAVGLLLLPFVRDLITGPTPLHDVESPTPGTGKGKLAEVCLLPGMGAGAWAVCAFPEEQDEQRKLITAVLMENRPGLCFDNVGKFLRSSVLAKALTDTEWSDRKLGASQSVSIPVRMVWVMTANNPQMSDEITRRTVPIRLIPNVERPEDRTGFRHPDLTGWASAHRAQLVRAAHVLIRHWLVIGRPAPAATTPPLGSYESYRAVIGGILTAAGIDGWLMNRSELRAAADPDTARWQAFVTAWAARFPDRYMAAAELIELAEEAEVHLTGETEKARKASLGSQLGQRFQRIYAGFRIVRGSGREDRRKWTVKEVTETPPW